MVALVEINPLSALETLQQWLKDKGVNYENTVLAQKNNLNIGVLYKSGVLTTNPRFIGSGLNDPRRRKAFVVNMKIGKFDFLLIVMHLTYWMVLLSAVPTVLRIFPMYWSMDIGRERFRRTVLDINNS